ncbi:IS256 family transposase [Providencia stuartii]|uniref:IS256 family transposase n=1 Tax=Providencia stuartii TaxID=588 RepID=UPI0014950B15|nr:IS256 family transposase [Providencia stuartii]NPD40702.1 IS256 family transposase [Providencia stuartii]NPD94334.1 IS256 family transposase [Providencia stuartii]
MTQPFDFDKALKALQEGQALTGKDGILTPLIKQLTEAALSAELDSHLLNDVEANRRNGATKKTIKTPTGNFELATPRDRNGSFEPQLVKKHQTTLSNEIEHKITRLFALGMSYSDISREIEDLYAFSVSAATISAVTDKVIPELKLWQQRLLDALYPFIWLDALHYKVKEDGRYVSKAVYTVLALNLEGKKDVLGLYLSESEGANFWLSVLTDLQNRGLKDILIACVDGLKGFPEAINSVYPQTQIQLCIIHMVRNSLKYVSWKDYKAVTAGLKTVYRVATEASALISLEKFALIWDEKYPQISKSWYAHWENLNTFFAYPDDIRKAIYTTNAIESLNSVIRHAIKKRKVFPSDDSVRKVIYLAIESASKKWSMPIQNWKQAMSRFIIEFGDRLNGHI